MTITVFNLGVHAGIEQALCDTLGAERGALAHRRFPDGEEYLRVLSPLAGHTAIILCGLDRPADRFLALCFLSRLLREQGAVSVGLVTPYLAYMRQDKRFNEGEALTSKHFADLLAEHVDWLVTVDPHLHRYHAMSDVYRIPALVVHAAPTLARWCRDLQQAFLIGPDAESEQWVSAMAEAADLPYVIAAKVRHGDRSVSITLPETAHLAGRTPVLVDDVVSSGMTMRMTLQELAGRGFTGMRIACVHALFAEGSDAMLQAAGAGQIASTNTIVHTSNGIDIGPLIAGAVQDFLNP